MATRSHCGEWVLVTLRTEPRNAAVGAAAAAHATRVELVERGSCDGLQIERPPCDQ